MHDEHMGESTDLILGIDLGTTNSLVGVVDSGFPILLADEDGQRLTPSAVYYPVGESGGEVLIGEKALRMRGKASGRLVTSVKRLMGTHEVVLTHAGKPESAVDVSARILLRLREIAESAMETSISRAVITVPAYFNDAQRSATKIAGEEAGMTVERIVSEPTAAALAWGLDKLDEKSRIAVYDFGGGTFDVSILELNAGVFQVLATDGDTRLGGDDIDVALAAYLWEKAGQGESETPEAFVNAAREAKCALSNAESHTVRLPFYDGTDSFEMLLGRDEFEAIAVRIIARTRAHCLRALADSGVASEELDKVILVGGSTRIPAVRSLVADVFGQEPDVSQNPDEAVALGAVIQAGILSGALGNMVLLDVTPLSLGIETFGGLMNVIIPRNSTIPVKRGEMFTNAVANQKSMRIRVLQGEREMARDNWQLGEFEIEFPPGQKGSARVGVQFAIDENGILQVLARDTEMEIDRVLEIQSAAVDVGDEKVEAMISESVEHAFDDMHERQWTEAKMKSDELLPAVREAMELVGDRLDGVERAAIETAVEAVRSELESGEVRALKEANTRLDEATEHMAALLVEKAMSE